MGVGTKNRVSAVKRDIHRAVYLGKRKYMWREKDDRDIWKRTQCMGWICESRASFIFGFKALGKYWIFEHSYQILHEIPAILQCNALSKSLQK